MSLLPPSIVQETNFVWWTFAVEIFMVAPPGLTVVNVKFPLGFLRLCDGSDVMLKGWRRLVQVDGGDGGRLALGIEDVVSMVHGLVEVSGQVVVGDGIADGLWQQVPPDFAYHRWAAAVEVAFADQSFDSSCSLRG